MLPTFGRVWTKATAGSRLKGDAEIYIRKAAFWTWKAPLLLISDLDGNDFPRPPRRL